MTKLTTHFTHEDVLRSDIAAAHGICQVVDDVQAERALWLAVHVLEPVTMSLGRRPNLSSWFRNERVNLLARGKKDSAHRAARAVDWKAPPWSNLQFARWIREQNIGELDKLILEYPSATDPRAGWVHVQVARKGEIARGAIYTAKRVIGDDGKSNTIYIEGLTI